MKTKNMRKKALLSSVAMLLVAVVALSGATYAWFSTNTTAKLNTISLTTAKSSSLLIAEKTGSSDPADSDYSAEIVASWSKQLKPVSTVDCDDFYEVTALTGDAASGTGASTKAGSVSPATETDYLHKVLFFKADDAVSVRLTSLTPTAGTTSIASALRVAFVVGSNVTIYGIGAQTNEGIAAVTGYPATAGTYQTFQNFYDGGSNVPGVTFSSVSAIAAGASSAAFLTLPANGAATQVDVYIWLEGNDSDCNNGISGGSLTNLAFQFDVVAGS